MTVIVQKTLLTKRLAIFILIIFVLSFVLRLVPVLTLPYYTGVGSMGDSTISTAVTILKDGYFGSAYLSEIREAVTNHTSLDELRQDDPSRTTDRMPLYPLILAAFIGLQGSLDVRAVQILQIVLDSCAAVLIFFTLLHFVSPGKSLAGGLIYAIWPPFIQFSFTVHDGAFGMFLNACILYLVVTGVKKRRFECGVLFLIGLLSAASILFRSDAIWLLLYIVFLLSVFYTASVTQRVKAIVVYIVTTIVLISPWTVRNIQFYDQFVITTPFYPITLMMGIADYPKLFKEYSHLNFDGVICPFAIKNGYQGPCKNWFDKGTQVELNEFYRDYFIEKIVMAHPFKYASHITLKWLRFFFAHRHITITGNFLGLPVGGLRQMGVGSVMDLLIIPSTLFLLVIFYHSSPLFWVLFLFPLISTFVHVFSVMNELRYIVSSTITFPIFFVLLMNGLREKMPRRAAQLPDMAEMPAASEGGRPSPKQ